MTKFEDILARMKNDPAFADAVFRDAASALAEYRLPAEHVARLKAMSRAEFEALAAEQPKTAQAPVSVTKENP